MNLKKNILSLAMTISLAASTAMASPPISDQCSPAFETCQRTAQTQYSTCAADAGSQYTAGLCSTNLTTADNVCSASLNACLMSNSPDCLDSCDSDSMCVNMTNSNPKTNNYQCTPKKFSSAPVILGNKNNNPPAPGNTARKTTLNLR